MDEIDRQILDRLQQDGRASYTAIADEIGVSEGTVRNRVTQLQADGVIERFTVEVAEEHQLSVIVMARLDPDPDITEIIDALPADMRVYETTGDWDLVLQFARKSSEAVNETLEAVRATDGVRETTTYTVLDRHRR